MRVNTKNIMPRYQILADKLREVIRSSYHENDRFPSQNELIVQYDASYCTVMSALSILVEEGWLRRERGRGTFVNPVPTREPRQDNGQYLIGVLMPGHHFENDYSPFMADLSKYLIKAANSVGVSVQFLPDRVFLPSAWKNLIRNSHFDGFICCNPNGLDEEQRGELTDAGPVVFSERTNSNPASSSWFEIDNVSGIRIGMERLLSSGHRRIALILGPGNTHPIYRIREKAYRDALCQARINYDPDLVAEAELTPVSGRATMAKLLYRHPDAVFLTSSAFGTGAINEILSARLRIPEDLSVLGYDDQLYYSPSFQCLSTVQQPLWEFASGMVQMLLEMIQGKSAPGIERILNPYLQRGFSILDRGKK